MPDFPNMKALFWGPSGKLAKAYAIELLNLATRCNQSIFGSTLIVDKKHIL
jgi:hypothetical protein